MSGVAARDKLRVLKVTAANVKNKTLPVRGLADFLPADCVGPAKRSKSGNGHQIEIVLDGLGETIRTDIGADAKTGKRRASQWQ